MRSIEEALVVALSSASCWGCDNLLVAMAISPSVAVVRTARLSDDSRAIRYLTIKLCQSPNGICWFIEKVISRLRRNGYDGWSSRLVTHDRATIHQAWFAIARRASMGGGRSQTRPPPASHRTSARKVQYFEAISNLGPRDPGGSDVNAFDQKLLV
jgi:hypothetical protein